MQNRESSNIFYGGFFARMAAAWTDALLVSCVLIFLRIPAWTMAGSGNFLYQPILFQFTPWDIFLYLLGRTYYVLLTYGTGATFGKKLFSLRVVSADGEKLRLFDVLYRETLGKYLSGVFLGIGYLMAGADREKRALHDMLCDTRVVYTFGGQPELRCTGNTAGKNSGESRESTVNPAQVAESYRNVEDYYQSSKEEKYSAADYGYQKPEETFKETEAGEATENEVAEITETQDTSDKMNLSDESAEK